MYTDRHGDQIEVIPCEGGDGPAAMVRTVQDGYVAVAPTDLAEFAAALHSAAGLPTPILLDRTTPGQSSLYIERFHLHAEGGGRSS